MFDIFQVSRHFHRLSGPLGDGIAPRTMDSCDFATSSKKPVSCVTRDWSETPKCERQRAGTKEEKGSEGGADPQTDDPDDDLKIGQQ